MRTLIVGLKGDVSAEHGERLKGMLVKRLAGTVDDVIVISQCTDLLVLEEPPKMSRRALRRARRDWVRTYGRKP